MILRTSKYEIREIIVSCYHPPPLDADRNIVVNDRTEICAVYNHRFIGFPVILVSGVRPSLAKSPLSNFTCIPDVERIYDPIPAPKARITFTKFVATYNNEVFELSDFQFLPYPDQNERSNSNGTLTHVFRYIVFNVLLPVLFPERDSANVYQIGS